MALWDTTALIASVKRRASIPTSQATLTTQDFLDVANEEMQGYVVPLLIAERSEYLVTEVDQLLAGQTSFRVPARAVGGKLRELQFVDTLGNFLDVPQLDMTDLDDAGFGFYVKGNVLFLWNSNQPIDTRWVTIRQTYYQRPGTLVAASSAGVILSINSGAKSVTLAATPPAGFATGVAFDLVRAAPGFESLATDSVGTVAGNTITFSALPADLAVGDYVCLAQQAPVAQVPLELHPLLQQAVAVKCLQVICDFEALAQAERILGRMEADAKTLLAQRVDGEARQVVSRDGLMRMEF